MERLLPWIKDHKKWEDRGKMALKETCSLSSSNPAYL